MTQPTNEQRLALFKSIIMRDGAMLNTGNHLGLMVAPLADLEACNCRCVPPGWAVCPTEQLTLDMLNELLDHLDKGRATWPEPEVAEKVAKQLGKRKG